MRQLANTDVLFLDDLTVALTDQLKRDLLEILDESRYDRKSTLVTAS